MANPIIAYPNHLDVGFYTPVVGGGSYAATLPASNVAEDSLAKVARTSGVTTADTVLHMDLGDGVPSVVFAIPFHNCTRSATYRLRASNTIAWSGVNATATEPLGETAIAVTAGASGAEITTGDTLTFDGLAINYTATGDLSLGASGSGVLNISPALEDAISGTTAITCHSGDYTSAAYDSGTTNVFPTTYPRGSLPYGHSAWWDGKITEETRQTQKIPIIDCLGGDTINAQYWLFEIDDTSNTDGYVEIPRVFIAPGWQPSVGIDYGASMGFTTRTRVDTTLSGRRVYDERPVARQVSMNLGAVPLEEGITQVYEASIRQNINKQIFFIFDPDDVELLYRRSFLATQEQLGGYSHPFFNRIDAPFTLLEVL
jgi:hypothetical protein